MTFEINQKYLGGKEYFSANFNGKPIAESWSEEGVYSLALKRLRGHRNSQRNQLKRTDNAIRFLEYSVLTQTTKHGETQ